jgi:hypothetical protein
VAEYFIFLANILLELYSHINIQRKIEGSIYLNISDKSKFRYPRPVLSK